ncbi:hypothetical protein C8R43DRAFT_1036920 [Mycena crocata]|nr:hypothetical protein C8R43DRAFT_1036920 [Mycena crocata]
MNPDDHNSQFVDDIAVLLGFRTGNPNLQIPQGQEMERSCRVMMHIKTREPKTEPEQDKAWSRFCALYLPATVERLLNLPVPTDASNADERDMTIDFPINNPWHEVLVRVQHLPYLAKYLRSSQPIAAAGKRLTQVLADRLTTLISRWDERMSTSSTTSHDEEKRQYYLAGAGSAIQLLSTLSTHYINETDRTAVISLETQRKLKPVLLLWGRRYNGQFLGDVSQRLILYMSQVEEFDRDAKKIRKMIKNWEVCGLRSCSVRKELKACGRCQTVRYCSPVHQKNDWSVHKTVCHKTDY